MSVALTLCHHHLTTARDALIARHLDYDVIELGYSPIRPCRACRQPAQQAILA